MIIILINAKKPFNFLENRLLTQEGLTLIEILVSLVLISIILITFFGFFSQTTLFSEKNGEKLVAFNLATRTLNIIEEKYNDSQIPITLNCGNFPPELKEVLQTSYCFYKQNNHNYYPEITLSKDSNFPNLYIVHVRIFSSENIADRKLLSETFGYVRQAI